MPRNDIVLLDSLVSKAKPQLGESREDSEIFELFCFDQVLKDHDLSSEELESGWTDGPDDGGVDGFFTMVDGHLASDADFEHVSRWNPVIRVALFTVRRSDSFQQDPLNALYSSLPELFDFTKAEEDLKYPFRTEVLAQRELFRQSFVSLADRRPQLVINIYFCCRGDASNLADNLTTRAEQLTEVVRQLFSQVEVTVEFLGAAELLEIARRQKTTSLRLRFIESYISREGQNYVVLASLPSYKDFVTDEKGALRRYLFESNVRDYLGLVQINRDIDLTLKRNAEASVEDFWWLNNGVTILATHATVAGKELAIENVQIVNGLQTTETIYEHFRTADSRHTDDRAILIKILLATDETIRARIVKATNYQNTVDLSALRGLDKIQLDIDHFLADRNWFYDRRKNFYKNQGRPAERIVSIAYLAAAVRAVALGDPANSQRRRSRALRDDSVYQLLFNPKWDLNVFLASLEITRAVETSLQIRRRFFETPPIALVHNLAFVFACSRLGTHEYKPEQVAALAASPPTPEEVRLLKEELVRASDQFNEPARKYQGVILRKEFLDRFVSDRY